MPKSHSEAIYELAEPRHGYFTSADAKAAGIGPQAVVLMASRGIVERISRGVYRLTRFPSPSYGQYMEAILWPESGQRGVLSHQSALAYHKLSDVSPAKVHITLPPRRMRRQVPPHLVIHWATLAAEEVETLDGIPVTTPEKTLRDCHTAGLGDRLIRQAITDGLDSGKLMTRQASKLRSELLGVETAANWQDISE
jgi:predicted transcriptional regulator of viral defense system